MLGDINVFSGAKTVDIFILSYGGYNMYGTIAQILSHLLPYINS
jgi:hypothetical protein